MSEADREVIKPEMMKSYIWLRTADGSIEQVEQEVAMFCPIICQEMHTGVGSSKNYPISLPPQLNQSMLSLILDYCQFHQVPGHSNKERRSFDEKFIRMDTKTLCELTSAADSLQLKPLVDLTSRALARMIEGKSPEEIRETFHLPDDLTEEEKLEPLKNITDDPRIRLLNRLYARKRKELQERDRLKNVEAEEERLDDRSVDDLLSFINGGSKDTKTSKPKKKNSRRKDQQKNAPFNCTAVSNDASSSINAIEFHRKECNGLDSVCHDAKIHDHVRKMLKLQNFQGYSLAQEDEFDDGDLDDEIDPALKEKIDRRTKPQVYAKLLGTTNQSQSTTSTMLYTFHSTNSLARTHCSRLYLYDFISRFYVQLPLLLAKRTYSHPLCFMMTCSPDDPNCFVLLLYNCVSSRNGCICKPGDNKWRKNVAKMGSYEDVIYYNGELYAIDKHA